MPVSQPCDDEEEQRHAQPNVEIHRGQHQQKDQCDAVQIHAVVDEVLPLPEEDDDWNGQKAQFPHPEFHENLVVDVFPSGCVTVDYGPQHEQQHQDETVGTVAGGDLVHSKRLAEQEQEGNHWEEQAEEVALQATCSLSQEHNGQHQSDLI